MPPDAGNNLWLAKSLANPADLVFDWRNAPVLGGGGRLYRVPDKHDVTDGAHRGERNASAATTATETGAVPQAVGVILPEIVYYQLVGYCDDNLTEGPVN